MIEMDITVPEEDIKAMAEMFDRYVEHYNGDIPKAVERTMVKIVVALRASTIKSKQNRKIVPYKKRFAKNSRNKFFKVHEIIQKYYEDHPETRHTSMQGDQKWLPRLKDLRGGNEFAKYAVERFTQFRGVKYQPIAGAKKVGDAKSEAVAHYPRTYKIMRRGVSYASWGWIMRQLGRQVPAEFTNLRKAVQATNVKKSNNESGGVLDFEIIAKNALNYIRKATKANVSSTVDRAATMMRKEMERSVADAAVKAGRVSA